MKLIEAFAKDYTTLALADNVVLIEQAQNRVFYGREVVASIFHAFFAQGFSEVSVEVQSIVVNEDKCVMEFILHGVHTGHFMSIVPTHRQIDMPMVLICEIQQQELYQATLYYDAGTLLRQLGLAIKH